MSRIRIVPALSALILTFAVLFGGLQVYRTYGVVNPLVVHLTKISAVQDASISMTGTTPTVTIALGPVADLQTTYMEIQNQIQSTLGQPVTVTLKDRRTQALRTLYESLQPILRQGIAHGTYVAMVSQLQKAAAAKGVKAVVTMNLQDIFVQLQTKTGYLYDIIQFPVKAIGGIS